MLQPATLMCDALGLEMPGLRRDAQTSRGNAPPTTRGGEGGWEGGTTRCPGTALDAPVGRWLPTLSSRSCPRLLLRIEHRPALTSRALFQDQRLAQRERKTKQGECLSDDRILSSQLKTISSVRHLFVKLLIWETMMFSTMVMLMEMLVLNTGQLVGAGTFALPLLNLSES